MCHFCSRMISCIAFIFTSISFLKGNLNFHLGKASYHCIHILMTFTYLKVLVWGSYRLSVKKCSKKLLSKYNMAFYFLVIDTTPNICERNFFAHHISWQMFEESWFILVITNSISTVWTPSVNEIKLQCLSLWANH